MLARRAPAWGIPGMWKPGATGSLRGVGIVALVTRFVGAKDFQPGQYWDLEALARALPGRCHVLDVDLPVRFLYVGEPDEHDDYPVLTLQQADDALEVVVEAPSLAAYYALRLGLIAPPTYVGGLYQVPAFAREMKAALARCGVTPARDRSRLHVAAPHRPPIEPPAPAEPSTRTTRTARTAPGHEVRLPDWVSELYPPFAATLREVAAMVSAADDDALLAAFREAAAETHWGAVEARTATQVRARLLRARDDLYLPHVELAYRSALGLDRARGERLLRAALAAKVEPSSPAANARPELVAIAVARVWSIAECRHELLETEVVQASDVRTGGSLLHRLGRAYAARTELVTAELEQRAHALAASAGAGGNPAATLDTLWLCCIALLTRDRRAFTPVVKRLGVEVQASLRAHGRADWVPLTQQAVETILRLARA